jgi:hypothetical protein
MYVFHLIRILRVLTTATLRLERWKVFGQQPHFPSLEIRDGGFRASHHLFVMYLARRRALGSATSLDFETEGFCAHEVTLCTELKFKTEGVYAHHNPTVSNFERRRSFEVSYLSPLSNLMGLGVLECFHATYREVRNTRRQLDLLVRLFRCGVARIEIFDGWGLDGHPKNAGRTFEVNGINQGESSAFIDIVNTP